MAVNIVTGMTGIEHITSHDDRARNASQFGRGKYVLDIGRKFSATAVDDNLVRIQDGMCINQGTQMGIEPNDYTDVEIDNGLLGTNRHDIIVMRYEKNEETLLEKASLTVVKGVNSSEPVDPDITEGNILDGGDLVDDMPLYRVVIEGVNLVSVEPLFELFDGDVGSIFEELGTKVDKVTGKGLSTNDYTNTDKTKLDGIETGAEVNVQADWSQNDDTADDFIKHKPSIPSKTSDLTNDSDFVSDANYVHTDNNYTNANKEDVAKIDTLETNQTQILSDVEVVKNTLGYEVVNLAINQSANSIIGYCESGKTYTLSYSGGVKCNLRKNSGSGDVIKSGGESPITFTADSDFGLFFNPFTSSWSNLQLEIGDTATEYTPYVDDVDTRLTTTEHSLSTTSTATGNPISISDSAHVNAEDLTVELEPIQDLHGYNKPWVGGAGKNQAYDITYISAKEQYSPVIRTSYELKQGKRYVISFYTANTDILIYREAPSILGFDSLSEYSFVCDGTRKSMYGTATADATISNVDIFKRISGTSDVESGLCYDLQIEEVADTVTTPTDYEPYSNICPISGYDETSVVRSGKNLLDYGVITSWREGELFTENDDVLTVNYQDSVSESSETDFLSLPAGTFTISWDNTCRFQLAVNGVKTVDTYNVNHYTFTLDSASDRIHIKFIVSSYPFALGKMQIELGSTATTYEPYTADTYTLQFGDTVYGGELDVLTGKLRVTHGEVDLGTLNWEYRASTNEMATELVGINTPTSDAVPVNAISSICKIISANNRATETGIRLYVFMNYNIVYIRDSGYTDATAFQTAVTGQTLVYELATPYTIQLTPQQIKILKGNNVLTADGDMGLTYQTDSVVGDVKEWAEEHFIPYNTYRTPPVYGFHIDGNNSDPSSRVTYIADNANFVPAYMDYTADKFRYGSWQDIWFIKNCKPCILNQDGTVKAYLNPNDSTKDIDGNTVVIDENLENANVMSEFPKIWYKVVPDAGDVTSASVYFSPVKVDEDYKDYAYIDKDGVHKEHFYMPAYNGSVLSGTTVMRSLSGQAVSKSLDASTEIAYAKANGDGWNTEDAGEVMLINFLLILLGKSTDTQTVFGRGIDTGGETAFNNYVTGAGNLKGLFYGTNTGTGLVKVFGIENWWGLQWRRYAGDVLDNGVRKVKLCYGNEDGSTTFDFNIDGTGYVDVGVTPSGTSSGYIRTMKFTHDGMYSAISDGSSSTYYCDGQWFNNTYHTIYALRGGSGDGLRYGAFCVTLYYAPDYRSWNFGAAVSYK